MAPPTKVPWPRDPHTAAKHAIFEKYLLDWWPIMLRGFGGDVTYAEGFAGPGVYDKREPGSPVIALRALIADKTLGSKVKHARLLFVDTNRKCVDLLRKRLLDAVPPHWQPEQWAKVGVDLEVRKGDCEPTLVELLDDHKAWGRPILAVLDTWGGGVSTDLVKRFAANKASEVVITIQPQYFARFAADPNNAHGDKVFGDESWRAVAEQPSERKTTWLRQAYRQTVERCGFKYVLDFELIDEKGNILYLVFGTTNVKGLTTMKAAMWAVDEAHGTGYRDPRDPNQETLAIEVEPQTGALRRLLLAYLAGRPKREATLHELRQFALFSTVYKESQARITVMKMLEDGQLTMAGSSTKLQMSSVIRLTP